MNSATVKALWLIILTGVAFVPFTTMAANTPITVSGFNRDLVIEATASGPPYSAAGAEFNPGEGKCFFQSGFPGKNHGLVASGSLTAASTGTLFQFQSYTANNALVFSSDTGITSGTLFLTAPRVYDSISILANSADGNSDGTATLTLHFNDGTTLTTNYYAPDWFNNGSTSTYTVALQGANRMLISTGATDGNSSNARFYESELSLATILGASNKPLSSITFGMAAVADATAVYALSGTTNASQTILTYTPAVVTNLPASSITTTTATLNGKVVSTGNDAPLITIYYGTVNGGTTPAAWQNSVSVGWQTGTFAQAISGLSFSTTYYFRAQAVNAGGTSWAASTASFATQAPSPATVANSPAAAITASSAAVYGKVLSTGGDTPAITVFYGPANGGTNAGAWAGSVPLGTEAGFFGHGIFGLTAGTPYYYTARAVNAGGTSWATPSLSFNTTTTNPASIPTAVLTQHNDYNRSGDNLAETVLNTGNVNTNTFGLVYTRPVDDQVYAQPLVMTNVTIPGHGTHNILYICTVNDTVYAFDADNASVTNAYWQTNYTGTFNGTNVVPPRNTDMTGACGGNYVDYSGQFGIVGTPAIDPVSQTMWFVARTKETSGSGTIYVQKLHALDITTGVDRTAPVVVSATVAGTGDGGSTVSFDPQKNNQRSALAFANGNVYIAWSSHCDWTPYHGWLMAYNATTLQQVAAYCDTANGSEGGIWMSGQGPAVDTNGNVYLSTGNGTVDTSGTADRAMSFLQFNGATLAVNTWFTPYNYSYLNSGDWDLGAGGLLLIPGTSLAIGGGKSSSTVPATLYLVNRNNMGGLSADGSDDNIVQSFGVTPVNLGLNHIHGAPVWWDGPGQSFLYVWGESDHLHQYQFDPVNNVFLLPAFAESATPVPVNAMTGSMLSISANGTNAGTGILWAAHQYSGNANNAVRPGILRAFDAQNVSNELWNTQMYPARDTVGMYAKFVPPTIANGKVYLATFSGKLNVYGLLPPGPPLVYQQPVSILRYSGDSATFSIAPGGTAVSYQWFNGANPIAGGTNSSLTLANVQALDAGSYACVLSNSFGMLATSNALLSVVAAPPVTYPDVITADHPMAYWRLDEANGSVAHDYFGNYNGVYVNTQLGLSGYSPADPDTAAGFGNLSSINSYVSNITGIDFGTFSNTATFSVEAWVNGSAQGNGDGIVAIGYGGGGEQLCLDTGANNNAFRFFVRDGATDTAHLADSSVGPDGNWHHLVGVCDETKGYLALYIDGVSNAAASISGGIPVATSPLSIGARQSEVDPRGMLTNFDLNFTGTIDEAAVYNYALSATQVQTHYRVGTNGPVVVTGHPTRGGLMLSWSLGTLQAAPMANGIYTNVPGAISPMTISASAAMQFYRVKVQ